MPTSVLLAVLAAASLLALAPALVRRYDAAERLVAERALSTARVLSRRRRRRSVPGRTPVNPPRLPTVTLRRAAFVPPAGSLTGSPGGSSGGSLGGSLGGSPGGSLGGARAGSSGGSPDASPARRSARQPAGRPTRGVGQPRRRAAPSRPRRRHQVGAPAVYRRRRVLAALLLLNAVELGGVIIVGPGFWVGVIATAALLVLFLAHLRTIALADRRRRRRHAREAAWLAAKQAEVRRAQERRTAERRAAQRRLAEQREAVRRAIAGLDRPGAARGQPYSIRYGGQPRDSRAAGF